MLDERVGSTRRRIPFLFIWHLFFAAVIVWFIPTVVLSASPLSLGPAHTATVAAFAGVYAISLLGRWLLIRVFTVRAVPATIAATASSLAAVYLTLLVAQPEYSRALLLAETAAVTTGMSAALIPVTLQTGALALVVVLLAFARENAGDRATPPPTRTSEMVRTALHRILVTRYANYLPKEPGRRVTGGALAADPRGGYILARPRGEIYRLNFDREGGLDLQRLGAQVPINTAEFESDAPAYVATIGFRVADIHVDTVADGLRLLVSHHYWKRAEQCFVVRLSAVIIPRDTAHEPIGTWRTVFESKPCLPIKRERGSPFVGEQIGGRIAAFGPNRILMTVGDHQFDGWYHSPNYVQDRAADYGKILLIDLGSGKSSIVSMGHRNQAGLVVDARGRIWATEIGPQGGDELNLIVAGRNYGWPYSTYGTEYGSVTWPAASDSTSLKLTGPTLSWVPSVNPAGLVAVRDTAFPRWTDDLLITSFTRSLQRIRLDGDRAAYAEVIPIDERMRDIATAGTGDFVIWTDTDVIVRMTRVYDIDTGAEAFTMTCGGCHVTHTTRYGTHGIGPSLRRVVGRPVASAKGFEFSDALARAGGLWTPSRLDAFMANPDSFAPGTIMRFAGIRDTAQRRLILEYLRNPE